MGHRMRGASAQDHRAQLFLCNQQTRHMHEARTRWLDGRAVDSARASMPPFNAPTEEGVGAPAGLVSYNVPTFGLRIPAAIMPLFDSEEIRSLSAQLGVPLPKYGLNKLVQARMFKVREIIKAARARDDCSGANRAAADALEAFCDGFEKLSDAEVGSPEAWRTWVARHVSPGWEERLHFDHLLGNFGFDRPMADALRSTAWSETLADGSVRTELLEHYAMRWLSKAFAGFTVIGCLADVANLLHAMLGETPADKMTEAEVVESIERACAKIRAADFSALWIPNHLVHDCETDDLLVWLLLMHIHSQHGSVLRTLIQLPTGERMEQVRERLEHASAQASQCGCAVECAVERDPAARNAEAVLGAFGMK